MAPALHELTARGIRVALDLGLGQLALFQVFRGGRIIAPFARVPWADLPDDPARFPTDMAPHLRRMSGDFFCAPFCADDVEDAPAHGWSANAAWDLISETRFDGGITARFRLGHRIAGAQVDKIWTLRDDHPFLYQDHLFTGGTGFLPVAHHAMLDLRGGGLLRFSPKLWAETPSQPLEPGRSALRYPATGADLTAFPGAAGPVDLTRYPIGQAHEDFVMLVDDPAQRLGWVTALRPASGDLAVMVKPVAVLPQTMMWFSNGGRDLPPWNGAHVGVLGIEEACALGLEGRQAATLPNRLTARGVPTALDLRSGPVSVATAMGAVPCAAQVAQSLTLSDDAARLDDGTALPFHAAHFG
jgi:hypothetical protein